MSHGVSIGQPVKLEAAWKRFFSPSNRYLSPLLIILRSAGRPALLRHP